MTDSAFVIVVLAVVACVYLWALDWSLRGQERLIAAWREDEIPEDRER